MVERIASILPAKGSALHSVSPDATVYEAVAMMAEREIAAVLVIEHGDLSESSPPRIMGAESSYKERTEGMSGPGT